MATAATTRKIPEQGKDTQGIVNAKPHDTETNQSTEVVEHGESKRLQAKTNISTTLEEGQTYQAEFTTMQWSPRKHCRRKRNLEYSAGGGSEWRVAQ